jgi:hypothetical protein
MDQIERNTKRGPRRAFGRSCLQDSQFAVLDGEFDILHIAEVLLQMLQHPGELGLERR